MLNYNQALPKHTLLQDLQMKEVKPIMKDEKKGNLFLLLVKL
jgi:hypothetical protein